jgi:hypothetical protein
MPIEIMLHERIEAQLVSAAKAYIEHMQSGAPQSDGPRSHEIRIQISADGQVVIKH